MRRVHSSANLLEAHHAKNLLEACGIRCELRNELLSGALGELPLGSCLPEVWVCDPNEAARAAALLEQGLAAGFAGGARWQCLCGEVCEPQFAACWRCGEVRPG